MEAATKIIFSMFSPFRDGAFILVLFISCNKEEPIPSYIHIDKIDLTTNYSIEGSNSQKILDAWVTVDDQSVGAFEMPCTFPILTNGNHTLKVFPGIKENGIAETRIQYPFYAAYQKDITFTRGQVIKINPTVTYSKNITFKWIEDFEGAGHSILTGNGSTPDTIMTITHSLTEKFEGAGSGKVSITSDSYLGLSGKFVLPQGGLNVFLELNYYCNTDFTVGIVGYNSGGGIEVQDYFLTLRPTSGWNKVYVNLASHITAATTSSKFAVAFSMQNNPNLSSSYFYLDNVKLIN